MPVRTSAIGDTQVTEVELSTRWALAYAASLGFDTPACMDDSQDDLSIPPTFCVCLEWATVGSPARAERLGLTKEETRRGVHALQDSTFFQPLRPGMRIALSSEIRYMRNTSAGAFILTCLESRDAATGALLVRSWTGSMMRGVPADAPQAGEAPDDILQVRETALGDAALQKVFIERTQPHVYTECARIWNPIHTERRVALAAGLPDIIVHGTATWALAAREVLSQHAGGDVRRLKRLVGRFRSPVIPGNSITVRHATSSAPGGVSFDVLTDRGDVALNGGYVELGPAS